MKKISIALAMTALVLFAGCEAASGPTGSVNFSISFTTATRGVTKAASGSESIVSGVIRLTKGSQTLLQSFDYAGGSPVDVSFGDVQVGNWDVYVALFDDEGFMIYEGSSTITVLAGQTASASVTVSEITGDVEIGIVIPGAFLSEDFSDGVANGFDTSRGTWAVSNETLYALGNSTISSIRDPYAMYEVGSTTLSDYTLEFDFRILTTTAPQVIIPFRVMEWETNSTANHTFYAFRLRLDTGVWYLRKCNNAPWSSQTTLATGTTTAATNAWNHVEITVSGSAIDVTLNDEDVVLYNDASDPILTGGFGLGCMEYKTAQFDDVELWVE